jgi:hypothetical protein
VDLASARARIDELEQEVRELRRLALEVRDLELGTVARAKSADWLLDQNDKIRSGLSWKVARASSVPVRMGQKVARRARSIVRG